MEVGSPAKQEIWLRSIEKTFPRKVRGTADPSAALGGCDFFDFACSLWLESWEEQLLTSIAGVLRLRAISRPLCDRSARRFAQDDGFVGGKKHPVSYAENTKRSKKSQALRMTALWGVKSIRLATQKTRKDRKSHRRSGRQRGEWRFHGERLPERRRFHHLGPAAGP